MEFFLSMEADNVRHLESGLELFLVYRLVLTQCILKSLPLLLALDQTALCIYSLLYVKEIAKKRSQN